MLLSFLNNSEILSSEWDQFIMESPQGNIYHLHKYLTNLHPSWDAIIVKEGSAYIAIMPLCINTKVGIKFATQPFFAQYLGILFGKNNENKYKELEHKKKIINEIHNSIPQELKYINYNFAPEFDYELPLKWLGWSQKTIYTYWLDIKNGYDVFLKNAASHVRREIKKFEQSNYRVLECNEPEIVLSILKLAKGDALKNIDEHFFQALINNSKYYYEKAMSSCFLAYDGEKAIAGIIYFFYKNKMIYYQGSTLSEYKNSGAMTAIIAESIKKYSDEYEFLDFDGSMIEPIERFFRGFGAFPMKYSNFTLNRLPLLPRLIQRFKSRI